MKNMKRLTKRINKLVNENNRRVSRDNKAFEKLSASEKRVAIARDVLEQIRLKRLVPTQGLWLGGRDGRDILTMTLVKKNPELKEVLDKMKRCEGCAIGGMFMCAVKKADDLKLNELKAVECLNEDRKLAQERGFDPNTCNLSNDIDQEDAFNYLERFFSREQLDLIESCFERNEGACITDDGDDFAPDCEDASERMRLIMENIVVNKGTFRPEKKPVPRYETPGFEG